MTTNLSQDTVSRVFDGDVILCTELLEESHESCERAWQIIEWLMAEVSDEDRARYVGTLFLEDFLAFWGRSALEELINMAATSALFVEALRVVDWAAVPRSVRLALAPFVAAP